MALQIRGHLDLIQHILQDGPVGDDGVLWSREELRTYLCEGYRQLLAHSQGARRWTVLPVPPMVPYACTHSWQQALLPEAGPPWAFQGVGGWSATHLWQLEQLEGLTPTAAGEPTVTHPWERAYANPTHQHFRFLLPRDHQRIVKLWYDHKLLLPISTRSLDTTGTDWYSLGGTPIAWTRGLAGPQTVEIYEIVTSTQTAYRHVDTVTRDANPRYGTTRQVTGDRTYDWESDDGDSVPYGVVRRVSSPDRQYWHTSPSSGGLARPQGVSKWWQSSADNLLVLEVVMPEAQALGDDDELAALPPQLARYARFHALARAYGRQGEGYDPAMSAFFEQLALKGLEVLRTLGHLSRRDRSAARVPRGGDGDRRPPRVRLPSTYPWPWGG